MAFNPFGEDTGVENFSGAGTTEEERKRRLAMLANLASGGTMGDAASLALTSRMNQATDKIGQVGDMIQNPEEAMKQRFITGQPQQVAGPVAPAVQPVQQPQPVAQAPMPVSPQEVQPVQQTQLPQPGPGVQVAGPTQLPPQPQVQAQAQPQTQQVTQPMPSQTPEWHDKLVGGDFNSLSSILANPNTPEDVKSEVQDRMYNILNDKRMEAQANQTIQKAVSGDPRAVSDLSKELTKRSNEGSILKAMLYSRLGLGELAKDEQQKLGAGTTYQAVVGPNNTRALIKYGADNMPISGFDESGKLISQESLASFAANAMPTKSHLMPSVHGTPVQRTNEQGQVETGLMMYDPRSQQSYVQVGNARQPTTGWTTMAQNVQAVYGAAGAKQQGTQAAQTGVQQPPLPSLAGTTPQPQVQAQSQVQAQPQARPTGPVNPATVSQVPQARPTSTPSQAQTTPTPTGVGGGGTPPVQRPGESFSSFEARMKTYTEQQQAQIQQQKELNVAEQKPGAEAKGKIVAKNINNQNFANSTYGLIKPINDAILESTGSGIGAGVDTIASKLGASTKGAQAIAQLEVLAYPILSNVPRFEGAQSDYDVKNYMKAAGDFANPEKPVNTRLAALKAMTTILQKYDVEKTNDWTFGGKGLKESNKPSQPKEANTGTTSSGNKYKRVE